MTLILYYHPFSSYCQKALIALYEKAVPFEPYEVDLGDAQARAQFAAIWPYAKFPVLHDVDAGITLPEASLICEYVDALGGAGPALLPAQADAVRSVRLFDRVLDNYLHTPMQKIVADRLRPEGARDAYGVEEARDLIEATYRLLESRLVDGQWLAGRDYTLADCSAAPPLFYAARLVPLTAYPRLAAYLARAMARPSFKRCLDEARHFRAYFPAAAEDGPWPDEDGRLAF